MIIGTCGFSWSGSSAVADLLAEFDENQVYNDDEFILAFYPDGLEDLDYQLNTKCSKFVSSTVAIPRFRKAANYLLANPTHGLAKEIIDRYIDSLVQVRWIGKGQGQRHLHNGWLYDHLGKAFTLKILNHIPEEIARIIKLYPLGIMEYSIKPDSFYEKTKLFTNEILAAIGLDLSKNIVLDQPFAGNNPCQAMKYYTDAKCIIVDRDPRDLYMIAKYFFKRRSYQIPHDTVDHFISYYYHMHKNLYEIVNNNDVIIVRFENLIFDYDNQVNKIKKFLQLSSSHNKLKYFDPNHSMANTRLFQKNTEYADDIKTIEDKLSEFVFDFDPYHEMKPSGQMFDENPPIDWKANKK